MLALHHLVVIYFQIVTKFVYVMVYMLTFKYNSTGNLLFFQ